MEHSIARGLQAWFDGETTAEECARIESLLERDPEARAYIDQLSRAREALHSAHIRADGHAQAFRQLERRLDAFEERRFARVIRLPHLLAAMAAIMLLGMVLWLPIGDDARQARLSEPPVQPDYPGLESSVIMVETDLVDAIPIVYIDQPSGWAVVWIMEAEDAPNRG
jgi:anti-sigma factor RsiW